MPAEPVTMASMASMPAPRKNMLRTTVARKTAMAMPMAMAALLALPVLAQQDSGEAEVHVLPVQGNVYMLVGPRGNATLQVGYDGVFLVDTLLAELAPRIVGRIHELIESPVRYVIVNTHVHPDHTGGNQSLANMGNGQTGVRTDIIAHENVLLRMTAAPDESLPETRLSPEGWPTEAYFTPHRDIHFNGEPIEILHQPSAHTDGDSLVFFRRSDVVSTGDIFTPGRYPVIDLARGGSVQGVIDALNRIIRIAVPEDKQEGGTKVIPGHGRLCEEADVVEYRDMVTIVRDRVQALIDAGMSLEEVQGARPSLDYDTEYGSDSGFWTTEMFVEAVYRSLGE